ncbi:unnamed protein product [Blepharisma stoltei]|uniref:Rhomboid-like protease n=1 Tax=Blepharisma stoltei TaxID=1481888 RepID=A0AAU9IY82_9CILI|nr:unnamed protein product [Blepharisma stoltei]
MAGIHSLRDLPPERRQRLVNDPARTGQYPLLGYGFQMGTAEQARKETFCQMLKYIFCPFFTTRSFIFVITVIDIVIYFVTVFYDYDSSNFLEPTNHSLDEFGAKDPEKMQQDYEMWRWLTPMVLHANLTHITFNMIMQVILGFRLEPTVGTKRTIIVYVVSGMGGILFSCLVSPTTMAVGASTSIFGITSAMLAWIIMNWTSLEGDVYRTITLIWLIMILIFNLIMGFASPLVDNWGHFGGLIVGFGMGYAVFEYIAPPNRKEKNMKIGMAGAVGFYFVLGFILFYTVVKT